MIEQPDSRPVFLTGEERKKYGITADDAYRLHSQYIYQWTAPDGKDRRVIVPEGLIYDGASVPRWAWTVAGILPDGLIRAAALIHDYFYMYKGRLPVTCYQRQDHIHWFNVAAHWPRKDVDRLFARILRESNYPRHKRRMAYRAVRLGGWTAWNSDDTVVIDHDHG